VYPSTNFEGRPQSFQSQEDNARNETKYILPERQMNRHILGGLRWDLDIIDVAVLRRLFCVCARVFYVFL